MREAAADSACPEGRHPEDPRPSPIALKERGFAEKDDGEEAKRLGEGRSHRPAGRRLAGRGIGGGPVYLEHSLRGGSIEDCSGDTRILVQMTPRSARETLHNA
jgi:hypothetical protein